MGSFGSRERELTETRSMVSETPLILTRARPRLAAACPGRPRPSPRYDAGVIPSRPRILTLTFTLALVPLACGDPAPADTDAATDTGGAAGTSTGTTAGPPTSTTVDPTTSASGSVGETGTTTTTTSDPTTTTTTSGGTTDDTGGTTGEPPPPPPDVMPELVCPGDPDGHCEPVDGAPLLAGASVLSIVPKCFESWVDNDKDSVYDVLGDQVLDCGCDRLCPGSPGYKGADTGEGNFTLQASWMAGFQTGRAAMGVRGADKGLVGEGDGLWARALVLEQGNTSLAIVTLDLIGYLHDDTLAVRELLAAKGLDVDYVLLHAIHNHEGPDTMGMWGPVTLVNGYDGAYRQQVRAAIVDAIVAADMAKQPVAQMIVGEVDVSTYHENGVANVIRDTRDPWVVDETLGALRLVGADDQTIASLVSFGNHPEALADKNNLLTADFVHGVRRTLEQGSAWKQAPGKPGVGGPCLYVNAAVGGMMTPLGVTVVTPDGESFTSASFEKADAIGQLLGEMALDALANGDVVAAPTLDLQAQTFKARVDNTSFNLLFQLGIFNREVFDMQDGRYIETEAALINLGPLQLLSVPGELLPELAVGGYDGSRINAPGVPLVDPNNSNPPKLDQAPQGPYLKDKMHGTYRWIIGLGNDELGYIIPEYDYVLGDPPWISEAEGDHYEETNSLGPKIFSTYDATADILLAWSKWVHGA